MWLERHVCHSRQQPGQYLRFLKTHTYYHPLSFSNATLPRTNHAPICCSDGKRKVPMHATSIARPNDRALGSTHWLQRSPQERLHSGNKHTQPQDRYYSTAKTHKALTHKRLFSDGHNLPQAWVVVHPFFPKFTIGKRRQNRKRTKILPNIARMMQQDTCT